MRVKQVACGLLIVSLGLLGASYFSIAGDRQPDLLPGEQLVAQLGARPAGDRVSHRFSLYNESAEPLRIRSVRTSCGCTVASTMPSEIPPRRRHPLDVTVQTGQMRGLQSFTTLITFEDGRTAYAAIEVDLVTRIPDVVEFGRVRRGDTPTREFDVFPTRAGERVEVEQITSDHDFFDHDFFDRVHSRPSGGSDSASRSAHVKVRLRQAIPSGPFDKVATLKLRLDHDQTELISIRLRGWVEGDVEADAQSMTFTAPTTRRSQDQAADPATKTLTLRSPYAKAFEVVRLESEFDAAVQIVAIRSAADRRSAEVDLSLDRSKVQAMQALTVRVVVSVDGNEQFIPIQCYAPS